MKIQLLFLLLFGFTAANAQIVNIPDPVFKNLLLTAETNSDFDVILAGGGEDIDINNDNEIQVSEALSVIAIIFFNNPGTVTVASFEGIISFANLQTLGIYMPIGLTSLDLSDLTHLQALVLFGHNLSVLNLSNCTSLADLQLTGHIGLLNCTNNTSLLNYSLVDADFNTVDFTGCSNLNNLDLAVCGINNIILNGCAALETLNLTANDLTTIDVSPCIALKRIDLTDCPINSVTFGNLPNLEEITLLPTQLSSVDVSGCPMLKKFECGSCDSLTALDFSSNPLLHSLNVTGYSIKNMNLKNGNSAYSSIFLDIIAIEFICIDEGEESYLTNLLNDYPALNVNTYCLFTPGGNYNTIAGQLVFDADNNGCGTGADVLDNNIKVKVMSGAGTGYTYSNYGGNYILYALSGSHTVMPVVENDWFSVSPSSVDVNFTNNNNNTSVQNFCIVPNGVHPDVEIIVWPANANPGFDADYGIVFKNKGNQVLSGSVTFNFDDSVLDFVSAVPAPASVSGGAVTWNYSDLNPFEDRGARVTLNANSPMDTPPLVLGDILTFTASITPVAGDETPADNTITVSREVMGSYDPNDITCLEGDIVSPDKIGEYLHYNINFENTGTAPATFVVVKDVIDATKFNVSSLEILYASHEMTARITGNRIEFIFDNINLVPNGKGNVAFKIKTLPTLQTGNDATQQADIFFDYNFPIETNEATTVFEVLSTGNFILDNSVTIYPNPSKGLVTIKADTEIKSTELYDVQGRLLQSSGAGNNIDMSERTSGLYFLKVKTGNGVKVEKLVRE